MSELLLAAAFLSTSEVIVVWLVCVAVFVSEFVIFRLRRENRRLKQEMRTKDRQLQKQRDEIDRLRSTARLSPGAREAAIVALGSQVREQHSVHVDQMTP